MNERNERTNESNGQTRNHRTLPLKWGSNKKRECSNDFTPCTNSVLSTIECDKEKIKKIINNLDPNKAHGHDMISIRMLKVCGEAICHPLEIIFKNCLSVGKFPDEWKKQI